MIIIVIAPINIPMQNVNITTLPLLHGAMQIYSLACPLNSFPLLNATLPSHCSTIHRFALATPCYSYPCHRYAHLIKTLPQQTNAIPPPRHAYPSRYHSLLCLRLSHRRTAIAIHNISVPPLVISPPRHCFTLLCLSCTTQFYAVAFHR